MPPLDTVAPDDELVIGARAIAQEIFGGQLNSRQVYRLLETNSDLAGLQIAGKWAARRAPCERRSDAASRGKSAVPTLYDLSADGRGVPRRAPARDHRRSNGPRKIGRRQSPRWTRSAPAPSRS